MLNGYLVAMEDGSEICGRYTYDREENRFSVSLFRSLVGHGFTEDGVRNYAESINCYAVEENEFDTEL